jgi:hypothetical protein
MTMLRETRNPTPQGIVARFAALPSYLPRGFHRFDTDEPLTLGSLVSGHVIAIDARWWDVLGCTSVNRWVSMDTTGPKLTAHESTPVHLVWREPVSESLAAGK